MTQETDEFEKYLNRSEPVTYTFPESRLTSINLMTHKEMMLEEIKSLEDDNFEIPPGLYIPLGSHVLVKEVVQGDHKTKGGIIISGAASLQNARIGIVFRVGANVTEPIKPGHKVAYDRFALSGIDHDGVQYTDLEEYQIKAIVPPENYLTPKYLTNEEKRRQMRQDFTKKSLEKTDEAMDKLQNDL